MMTETHSQTLSLPSKFQACALLHYYLIFFTADALANALIAKQFSSKRRIRNHIVQHCGGGSSLDGGAGIARISPFRKPSPQGADRNPVRSAHCTPTPSGANRTPERRERQARAHRSVGHENGSKRTAGTPSLPPPNRPPSLSLLPSPSLPKD
ncbi:hypothetical protein T492DRAFT_847225 [Pavlovales sp. CCMP2436]|nr:hypothetical protein T492DRAFT_847225 [Pavlovales sp. CCMP2436]